MQTCYSRDCHVNTAEDVFRRGQRNLGREFQCNPVSLTSWSKTTGPSSYLFSYCICDVIFYLHPNSTANPQSSQKCLLPAASSKACSSHAAPHCWIHFWHWSCTAWKEVSCKWFNFSRKLLTEISSILQSDFGDPTLTAEVVIRHVGSFKIGLHFAENFP